MISNRKFKKNYTNCPFFPLKKSNHFPAIIMESPRPVFTRTALSPALGLRNVIPGLDILKSNAVYNVAAYMHSIVGIYKLKIVI